MLTELYAWEEINATHFTSVGRQINSESFVHDVKSSVGMLYTIVCFLVDNML